MFYRSFALSAISLVFIFRLIYKSTYWDKRMHAFCFSCWGQCMWGFSLKRTITTTYASHYYCYHHTLSCISRCLLHDNVVAYYLLNILLQTTHNPALYTVLETTLYHKRGKNKLVRISTATWMSTFYPCGVE